MLPLFARAAKIIILPGSFYQCGKLLEVLDERFVVFCREEQSYNYLVSARTKAKIILDHDMALRLQKDILTPDSLNIPYSDFYMVNTIRQNYAPGKDVGVFLRNDCEKSRISSALRAILTSRPWAAAPSNLPGNTSPFRLCSC